VSTPVKVSWLKEHERIVITFLVLSFGIFGFNHWLDKSATDAKIQAVFAGQVAAQSKATADQALAQLAQQQAAFVAAEQAHEKVEASLAAAIASRDTALVSRVTQVEAPKTPTQAVTDLDNAYTLPVPLTVTADGADVPTADLQLFTVTKIEGATCTQDLQDTRSELTATTDSLNQATKLISTAESTITDLKAADVKTAAANAAEVKDLKAQARKHGWRWFWAGFAAGFAGRSAMGAK
jgi:hypothetical protein